MVNKNISIFINIFFVLFMFTCGATEKLKTDGYKYNKCIACQYSIRGYFTKLFDEYGSIKKIRIQLEQIAKGKIRNKFPQDFYNFYGTYFLGNTAYFDDPEVVTRYLLEKGVHPCSSTFGASIVASEVLLDGKRSLKSFQVIIDSGKLLDCPRELEYLSNIAQKNNLNKNLELLNKLL